MATRASTTGPGREGLPTQGETDFRALCDAFGRAGGVARADGLARLLEQRREDGFVDLARLIGRREVIAFGWRGSLWLPMFQLDLNDLTAHAGTRRVLAELRPVLDPWGQAVWFVRPNGCLHGRRPIDLIDGAPDRVLGAARVERFFTELSLAAETPDRRPS